VLSKFVVNSSLAGFNCIDLNSLRRAGHLKGEYSCQNQTVADESQASSRRNARSSAMVRLLLSLFIAVLYSY